MVSRVLVFALLLPLCVQAAEVAGVKIDDKARVGSADLVLNGAGLRKRVFFQVYAIGLYLPQKSASPAAVLGQQGAKRVAIHMLRDVGADTFTEALVDGIRANHSEAEAKALEPRVKELAAVIAEIKEAKKGMAIALDWQPPAGTVMLVDGAARGKPIAGEDFYRALLRIWIGDKPVQDDLKKALLGG
jgi:Chalcone isomerase-like